MTPSADREHRLAGQTGLYLHVPFCVRKCPYCSFFSATGSAAEQRKYVRAVQGQLKQVIGSDLLAGVSIGSIFVGGGTPSVLGAEVLGGLLADFRRCLPFRREETETSVEVNPATIDYQGMRVLRSYGYNRISIGIQSLNDRELKALGRVHSSAEAGNAVGDARRAGFAHLNIDLMYGLPGQSVSSWQETLDRAIDLQPDHLSVYELMVEKGTPFARQMARGELLLPGEGEILAMMDLTRQMVGAAGYERYEISNFARPGRECLHNINYWRNGWYLGLGPGAVSGLAGKRWTAVPDTEEFSRRIIAGQSWWSEVEELEHEARFRETVIMGLRMTAGLSLREMEARFGLHVLDYYGETLQQLERQQLVVFDRDRLRLSPKGVDLANLVLQELV